MDQVSNHVAKDSDKHSLLWFAIKVAHNKSAIASMLRLRSDLMSPSLTLCYHCYKYVCEKSKYLLQSLVGFDLPPSTKGDNVGFHNENMPIQYTEILKVVKTENFQ